MYLCKYERARVPACMRTHTHTHTHTHTCMNKQLGCFNKQLSWRNPLCAEADMTLEKLRTLDDAKLLIAFGKLARYHRDAPEDSRYSVRIGCGRAILSGDTADLFAKFKAEVRRNPHQRRTHDT